MSVSVKGLSQLSKTLSNLEDLPKDFSRNGLKKIAFLVQGSIVHRVQDLGEGLKGKMRSYTPSYKKQRLKNKLQNSFRSMSFTGNMWRSSKIRPIKYGYIIGFGNKQSKDKAKYNQKRTPFMGMARRELTIFNKELKRQMDTAFKKL